MKDQVTSKSDVECHAGCPRPPKFLRDFLRSMIASTADRRWTWCSTATESERTWLECEHEQNSSYYLEYEEGKEETEEEEECKAVNARGLPLDVPRQKPIIGRNDDQLVVLAGSLQEKYYLEYYLSPVTEEAEEDYLDLSSVEKTDDGAEEEPPCDDDSSVDQVLVIFGDSTRVVMEEAQEQTSSSASTSSSSLCNAPDSDGNRGTFLTATKQNVEMPSVPSNNGEQTPTLLSLQRRLDGCNPPCDEELETLSKYAPDPTSSSTFHQEANEPSLSKGTWKLTAFVLGTLVLLALLVEHARGNWRMTIPPTNNTGAPSFMMTTVFDLDNWEESGNNEIVPGEQDDDMMRDRLERSRCDALCDLSGAVLNGTSTACLIFLEDENVCICHQTEPSLPRDSSESPP